MTNHILTTLPVASACLDLFLSFPARALLVLLLFPCYASAQGMPGCQAGFHGKASSACRD